MRALAALAVAVIALSFVGSASAQGWDRTTGAHAVDDEIPPPPSTASTGTFVVRSVPVLEDEAPPIERGRRDHSVGMIAGGSALLVVGYAASAIWGGYYVDSLHLGPQGCNDTYAAWQFVPVLGPIVGVFAGGACVPGGLHFEEAVLPFVFSIVEIAGVVLTSLGAFFHDRRHAAPRVAAAVDPGGGFAQLAWSF